MTGCCGSSRRRARCTSSRSTRSAGRDGPQGRSDAASAWCPRGWTFWPTNGFLIVFAIAAAAVGWRAPGFALALPAGLLINAVLFHVVPSIAVRRPNPGCFTAVALYLPVGVWAYVAAADDGALDAGTVVLSAVLGAAAMAAVVLLPLAQPRFGYPDVRRDGASESGGGAR